MDDGTNIQFPRHRRSGQDNTDKFLKIRNILNIIFMIGAIAGVIFYITSSQTTGIIIIMSSMVFKIADIDSCLRDVCKRHGADRCHI